MANTKSQNQRILDWLQSGLTLSPYEALRLFGCFRLGARIYDLKEAGHNIVNTKKSGFAVYKLEK